MKLKIIYKFKKYLVENFMKEHDLSIISFCTLIKISLRDYEELMNNDPDIDTMVFAKLTKLFNVKMYDLFE